MDFIKKLEKKWKEGKFVCIGLDSALEKLPKSIKGESRIFEFNKKIIDKTHDLVCCYKPNSAFYEAEGLSGIEQLKKTTDYISKKYPDIPIILDAKRGDIGNTNAGYVKFVFDYLKADAVTVNPYLGQDAMQPFLDRKDKGIVILCKNSNKGSDEFQNIDSFYLKVAKNVASSWNRNKNCALVVGATYPSELSKIRKIIKDMPVLIPGIGAQGGDLESTVKNGLDSRKEGIIISSSRGIIFASSGSDFAEAARQETEKLTEEINRIRSEI